MAAVVPLVPDKAREGAWGWLLRRHCTMAAVVPLVPDKARREAWGWLLLRRCTVAAVVPLVPDRAREGAFLSCDHRLDSLHLSLCENSIKK